MILPGMMAAPPAMARVAGAPRRLIFARECEGGRIEQRRIEAGQGGRFANSRSGVDPSVVRDRILALDRRAALQSVRAEADRFEKARRLEVGAPRHSVGAECETQRGEAGQEQRSMRVQNAVAALAVGGFAPVWPGVRAGRAGQIGADVRGPACFAGAQERAAPPDGSSAVRRTSPGDARAG